MPQLPRSAPDDFDLDPSDNLLDSETAAIQQELFRFLSQSYGEESSLGRLPFLWDPQSPEMEAYLQYLEQDWPDEVQAHFAPIAPALAHYFQPDTPEPVQPQRSLQRQLQERFPQLPAAILSHLFQQTQTLSLSALSLAEQLVYCIQDLFPDWSQEDLQVLTRPYAYAFRCSPETQKPPEQAWETLSELERIRLCLAVAKMACTAESDDR